MRNKINLVQVIHEQFKKSKKFDEDYQKSQLEEQFYQNLTPQQKSLYNQINSEKKLKSFVIEMEIIQYVLDFISSIYQTRDNTRIYFD